MILVTFAELGYAIFTLEHTDTQFLILTIFHSSYLTSAPNFLYERNKTQNNGGSTWIKDRFFLDILSPEQRSEIAKIDL